MLRDSPGDKLKEFLTEAVEAEVEIRRGSEIHRALRQVMKFMRWKTLKYPESVSEIDTRKIESRNPTEFLNLTPSSCKYTKSMMGKYIEHLWRASLQNEFLLEGHSILPEPTSLPLPIDRATTREVEVLTMSLFHDNNLLNHFLHRFNSTLYTSPLCDCGNEEQTAHHVLFRCNLVDSDLRDQAFSAFQQAVGMELAVIDSNITLINASRHSSFMQSAVEIVNSIKNRLRSHIEL